MSEHYKLLDHIDSFEGSILEISGILPAGSSEFFAGLVAGLPQYTFVVTNWSESIFENRLAELAKRIPTVKAFNEKGETFLSSTFPKLSLKVGYAYLDGIEWDNGETQPWDASIEEVYKLNGITLSNEASAKSHLDQIKLLMPHFTKKAIVQFGNTTKLENGKWTGKGSTAIPFLLENGWKVLDATGESTIVCNF